MKSTELTNSFTKVKVDAESLIKNVKDIFGDLGDGFIEVSLIDIHFIVC